MTTATPFERHLEACPQGHRLGFSRRRSYDSEYGLFYSESEHEPVGVTPGPKSLPGADWIHSALARMVHGEGGGRSLTRSVPRLDRLHGNRRIDIETFPVDRYIELCEEAYVFGGLADNLIGPAETPKAQRFLNLISNQWLGSTANRGNVKVADVSGPLERADRSQAPIQLLLPAMPFKDQCAFRTDAPPDHVDLGEIAFLVRMHCLALAINQMHRFDCECVIISDGTVYAPIFGVGRLDAVRYLEHLRSARDRLNLAKSIHIVDLADLVRHDDEHRRALGYPTHRAIVNKIKREIKARLSTDDAAAAAVRTLSFGMRWNLNTRRYLEAGEVEPGDLWNWLRERPSARRTERPTVLPGALSEAADEAALRYSAFNLAISYTGLLARYFPDAVRLTSHAKSGQVAAPRLGTVYPWNGVAFSDALGVDDIRASSIRSVELHSVMNRHLLPVFERNGRYPICYTEEGHK